MASLVVSAVAKWNGAALKKGQKDLTAFQRTTLNLAKAFATTFAAQKIYAFGKASVKAFAADEKAAKSLETALKNTGNGFAAIATEGFISRMQQTYKVLDDELRPAFQTLLQATGSLTESQKGLELALNVSKGTTKSVGEVSMALAKAYSGQTTALSRLGAGLDKATLKSGDMKQIMAELTAKFQGQALAATKTYAGQMDALAIAAANSKEIIGKGLLDSISALAGQDGIATAADAMETLSQNVADTVYGFSLLISKAEQLIKISNAGKGALGLIGATALGAAGGFAVGGPGGAAVGGALALTGARATQLTGQYGKQAREAKTPYSATSMYFTVESAERAKNTAIIKKNTAAEAAKLKQTQAELDAKKKAQTEQANLDELKKKFDVGRINLETALANSTDEAEKARIRSLLTIMDEDAAAAGKRLQELDKANAEKMRQEYLAAISLGNLAEAAKLAALGVSKLTLGGVPVTQFPSVAANPIVADAVLIEADLAANEADKAAADAAAIAAHSEKVLADYLAMMAGLNAGSPAASAPVTQNFVFNDAVGTSSDFADAVKRAIQQVSRWGDSTTYAGAIV
jgi:hypothetical protein